MPTTYDAIVIGGGHNGLTAAAYLARAGKSVLVLERSPMIGGATRTEEPFPGFKFSVFSYLVSLLRPEIIYELDLPRHGLQLLPFESAFSPIYDQGYVMRWHDYDMTRQELMKFSPLDAEAYPQWGRIMAKVAHAVQPIINSPPPDLSDLGLPHLMGLMEYASHLKSVDHETRRMLVKLLTMSAADLLDEYFETDALKAAMCGSGIIGTFLGPRSPGSGYVLLHHYMGGVDGVYREWAFQKGGTGAVAKAVASAAVHHGAVIRTDCEVAEVIVSDGQAAGVRLVNGEEFKTKAVVSAADPKRTFLDFLDPQYVPDDLRENIERWKIGGCSAKVNIALDALPTFTCLEGRHQADYLRGAIAICPSMDYVEQAYDDAKYGNFSQRPYIDAMIPSLVDPDMAPPGKHVMSCFVQYAPDNIDGGWDEAKREAFGEAVIDAIAAHAPDIREKLIGKQVLVPPDITAIAGITGGNIFHGELYLHQVWALRPGLRWSRYRTPVENYWQCGSGTHPGGGISGTSGRLAALEMLGRGQK